MRKRQKKERADARRGIDRSTVIPLPPPLTTTPASVPAALVPSPSLSTSSEHDHNVGIIGCGSWFFLKAHLPHLSKLHVNGTIRIAALYSPSQESINKCLVHLRRNNIGRDPLSSPIPSFVSPPSTPPPSVPPPSFFRNLHTVILTVPHDVLPSYLLHLSTNYPNLAVITEKPALPSISSLPPKFLSSLMHSRRANIAVLENWILKPSYLKVRGGEGWSEATA